MSERMVAFPHVWVVKMKLDVLNKACEACTRHSGSIRLALWRRLEEEGEFCKRDLISCSKCSRPSLEVIEGRA